jgi:LPXTG-motif cell wall-anchored protein/uncharacterized repeat protein (TIGR01451 family)
VDGYEVKYSDPVTLDVEKSTSGTITITNTKESEPPVEPEKPELTITKTVTPASRVGSSGTFTYTLVVKNNGEETLFSVVVEDVFTGPAGATYTYNYSGGDDEPTFDPETNTFFLGDMEGGATITITYTVDITGRGTHDNKATVRGWTELEDELTDDDDASVELRRSGGGGGGDNPTPTPTPTPPVDIPEEPIPEGPAPVDDSTVEILEEEVPLSPVPKTGVNDNIALMALLMLGSLAGIGALTIRRRSVER